MLMSNQLNYKDDTWSFEGFWKEGGSPGGSSVAWGGKVNVSNCLCPEDFHCYKCCWWHNCTLVIFFKCRVVPSEATWVLLTSSTTTTVSLLLLQYCWWHFLELQDNYNEIYWLWRIKCGWGLGKWSNSKNQCSTSKCCSWWHTQLAHLCSVQELSKLPRLPYWCSTSSAESEKPLITYCCSLAFAALLLFQ